MLVVRGRHVQIDAIVILRWSTNITAIEAREAIDVVMASRRACRRPLAMITQVEVAMEPPGEAARAEFVRVLEVTKQLCKHFYAVVPADAEHRTHLIASITAFLTLLGTGDPSDEIFDSLRPALRAASIALGLDPESVIAAARDAALLLP